MSILLDTPKRTALAAHSTSLRVALKEWEKDFADAHNGAKPGKDDIRSDRCISAKYKEYNRVRDVLAGKLEAPTLQLPKRRSS